MFQKQDASRNAYMLTGPFARKGYDWWWHSFTAKDAETGEEKPFFIEFFLCNPALGGNEPVLGQLPANKAAGKRPSYLMVKAGCWGEEHLQLHRFFGWKSVNVRKGVPYFVKADDCYASETELKGSIIISKEENADHPEWMCDAGSMTWNLQLDKKIAFNVGYGASRLFRDIKAFEMYWHAEGMKTLVSGSIVLNNRKYIVEPGSSYGYADKNWGRGFTSPWVWVSSCCLKSRITGRKLENSVFDIGGGRPKIFFYALNRQLLSAFWYEGRQYEYNFSKFWTGCRTGFSSEETETHILWHVKQETFSSIMETEISCLKSDMLLVNYEAPDGSKRHNRLWNGGNGSGTVKLYKKRLFGAPKLIDDIEATHVGCEYGEYDAPAPFFCS